MNFQKILCFILGHRFTKVDWSIYYRGDVTFICEKCGITKNV